MSGNKSGGAPVGFVVGGGSTSSKHDKWLAAKAADTKQRRQVDDWRFALAREKPQEARIYSRSLGGSRTHAMVVLGLKAKRDATIVNWITCELLAQEKDDGGGDELTLVVCCPNCVLRESRSPEECQIHIRQSNRMFHLDQRTKSSREPNQLLGFCAGDIWVNPFNPAEVITIAGMITLDERAKCPVCKWGFRIKDSVLYGGE